MAKPRARSYAQVNLQTTLKRFDTALTLALSDPTQALTLIAHLRSDFQELVFGVENELSEGNRDPGKRPDAAESPSGEAEPAPASGPKRKVGRPRKNPENPESPESPDENPAADDEPAPLAEDCVETLVDGERVDVVGRSLKFIVDPEFGVDDPGGWFSRLKPEQKLKAFEAYGFDIYYLKAGIAYNERRYSSREKYSYMTKARRFDWLVGKHRDDVMRGHSKAAPYIMAARNLDIYDDVEVGRLL